MIVNILSASETAFFLRFQLGNLRSWEDVLADMRRGKSSYYGFTLLPFCRIQGSGLPRPAYRLTDVQDFIDKVSLLRHSPAKPHMLSIQQVEIDPTDKRHWSVRVPSSAF